MNKKDKFCVGLISSSYAYSLSTYRSEMIFDSNYGYLFKDIEWNGQNFYNLFEYKPVSIYDSKDTNSRKFKKK